MHLTRDPTHCVNWSKGSLEVFYSFSNGFLAFMVHKPQREFKKKKETTAMRIRNSVRKGHLNIIAPYSYKRDIFDSKEKTETDNIK